MEKVEWTGGLEVKNYGGRDERERCIWQGNLVSGEIMVKDNWELIDSFLEYKIITDITTTSFQLHIFSF